MRALAVLAALLAPSVAAAQAAGEQVQIIRTSDMQSRDTRGSSGSSHDSDALIERIVAVTPAGVELEYSLPPGSQPSDWTFPLRVFRPRTGPLQLRNRAELEARIDKWLKDATLPRSACGHWVFTWNAFRIECDPETALRAVEAVSIDRQKPVEGAAYTDDHAIRAVPLKTLPNGKGVTAELALDPDTVRKELADADLVIAEINRKPLTPDAARTAHAADRISGTIKVTIDTDATGEARRRTRITAMTITRDGQTETRTTTEVIERRPVRPQAPDPNSI